MTPEVICKEVIVTTLLRRGDGKATPIRCITQVYEKDGTLIAERDVINDMGHLYVMFAKWAIINGGGDIEKIDTEMFQKWQVQRLNF